MLKNNPRSITLDFAGHSIQLLASGACYWPQKRTLIVADLHFEKGSYFALRGQPIPLSDTRSTLEKLQQEILTYQPETIICLGDNVHDARGFLRMQEDDFLLLHSLHAMVENWLWIIGNHDTDTCQKPSLEHMQWIPSITIDNVCFSHELQSNKPIQVIGHYHPKVSILRQGITLTGSCFIVTENTLIMPAFGTYTGGLNINNQVFENILPEKKRYFLIFKDNIFLVK